MKGEREREGTPLSVNCKDPATTKPLCAKIGSTLSKWRRGIILKQFLRVRDPYSGRTVLTITAPKERPTHLCQFNESSQALCKLYVDFFKGSMFCTLLESFLPLSRNWLTFIRMHKKSYLAVFIRSEIEHYSEFSTIRSFCASSIQE